MKDINIMFSSEEYWLVLLLRDTDNRALSNTHTHTAVLIISSILIHKTLKSNITRKLKEDVNF